MNICSFDTKTAVNVLNKYCYLLRTNCKLLQNISVILDKNVTVLVITVIKCNYVFVYLTISMY